ASSEPMSPLASRECRARSSAARAAARRRRRSSRSNSSGPTARRKAGRRPKRTMTARPTATPGEAERAWSMAAPEGGLLFLVEASGDQILDGGEGVVLIVARDGERDVSALGGREQEDAEDALPVDLLAVLADLDLGAESAGRLDELRRRPGV